MTWAKFDDGYPHSPKIMGLSDRAFRLHVTAICYAAQHMTDGFIPAAGPRSWTLAAAAGELVAAGLFEPCEPGGWVIHDFLVYNPSREQVEEERAAKTEQRRAAGRASAQARRQRETNGPFNGPLPPRGGQIEQTRNPVPTRPVPSPTSAIADDLGADAPSQPPRPSKKILTDEQRAAILADPAFAGVDAEAEIAAALNHTASKKALDLNLYVRTWMRRAVEFSAGRNGNGQPRKSGRAPSEYDFNRLFEHQG